MATTMKLFSSCLALVAVLPSSSHAFIFDPSPSVPNAVLTKFPQTQTGKKLKIALDVGSDKEPRMSINNLVVELFPDAIDTSVKHPSLPGFNGPQPKLSTGPKSLSIKEDAYFINTDGMQHVSLEDGCWELIWKDDAPAGSLVCGFFNPTKVQRNDAVFPQGPVYIIFPVWTTETLHEHQTKRKEAESRARMHQEEKEDCFRKMESTNNPIMKAWHYRNAAAAMEKFWATNVDCYQHIPSNQDVMALEENLVLATKGTLYTKGTGGFFGAKTYDLMGTATVSAVVEGNLKP